MSDHDEHLEELARQCASVTPFGRLAGVEQIVVLRWLLDGGHITRTGKPLERPRQMPAPRANNPDGTPIYDKGTNFSPTETVTLR